MTQIVRSHEILVHAPLQSTFEYVADLTRHPEWSGAELRIEEASPGPIAMGKVYRSRGAVAVQKERPNTVRVSEFEPPHRLGFVANDPDFGDVSHVFTFDKSDGGLRITRTVTLHLQPVIAVAFRLFVYPLIGKPSMDKAMQALKAKLESGPFQAGD